jgi:hypothetical protein
MGELCEHQRTSDIWVVEVRPPEHECIFCHVERIEGVLKSLVRALDLIAGTHGAECANPRAEAAEALRQLSR